MSDSEHSTITYTSVSIPVEDDSDMGSPGVDGPPSPDYVPGLEEPEQEPPSPDYVPGPEEPEQAPPSPVYLPYVPEPVYPEYIPPEDDVFPAEEQPLPAATSPTADSPGYIPESDPERDPEEDDEEDPEEDPVDYPTDRQDDDDDDDDDDEDEDEEEEEEHPASSDSVPPVHRMTARISIRDEPSISLPPKEEVERLLALTTPPLSPLTLLSSPLSHIPSPPFPASPPASVLPASPPASPIHLLGYRAAMIRLRAETPSTSHPLPLPTSLPPPNIPTHIEVPKSCLPLQKRLRFSAPTPNHEELDYGITDTCDDLVGAIEEIVPTTLEGVNQRVTNLSTTFEQETTIMYGMMEDAQDDRMAREAWGLSMDASDYARSDVMSLRTTIVGQRALISELQSADHRRQGVIKELLAADYQRQVQLTKALKLLKGLQTQMAEFQRQYGLAKGPAQPDAPGEAGSSS
ncbi:hypothetical protein Tco_0644034 [Tanacetum coccineum]